VDVREIWYSGAAIQGDHDAVIFNPISSTILKWLRLRVVSWRHDVQPCTDNGSGLFDCWIIIIIVGIFLAKLTMETIVYCMGKRTIRALLPLGTEVL
jgi:hypothetical protein